jgi:MFS family permease
MRAGDAERPATFRDVLSVPEFRAIYAASAMSWVGDYLARAAITALIYHKTGSVAAAAAAFAISFAPWLLGGPVLASIAERYPYRTVMVACDLVRAAVMCVIALPWLPTPAMLALLLLGAMFAPPFEAARSATLPAVLAGDRYVVGVALHTSTALPAQITGYFLGGVLAGGGDARMVLLLNAVTFAVSAVLIRFGTVAREPALARSRRTHLLRETVDGFRLVFNTPALRALVLLIFSAALFVVVPEGLGAAWAVELTDEPAEQGFAQATIMASVPLGSLLGALLVARLVGPANRRRILRPLAIAVPLFLVPSLLQPPLAVVAVLAGLAGFAVGAAAPIANGEFVKAVPNAFRARAFGVVQGGLQVLQGSAVLVTGLFATGATPIPVVVGFWSLVGVVLLFGLSLAWPASSVFAEAVRAADAANAEAAGQADGQRTVGRHRANGAPGPRSSVLRPTQPAQPATEPPAGL